MCGIAGFVGGDAEVAGIIDRMASVIGHRGPDDEGALAGPGFALGHRRLAIIDLAGGHQPMVNADRTLAIVFNGEIYNYRQLMAELKQRGHRFSTNSDTEVILHLYEEEGPDCPRHLHGMFAFAVVDLRKQVLFLARDRLGKKPLYLWQDGGRLAFASEIKALLAFPGVPREPDLVAIDGYLSMRYVPGPRTMFKGIRKLPPGGWLRWRAGAVETGRYWSLPPIDRTAGGSDREFQETFDRLFSDAVDLRLVSDVPVGAFLSGGLDSSCIVAAMARRVDGPLHTFSVGFDWSGDETTEAAATARLFGCQHHEVICRPEDMGLLPEIVWHSDQPLGDAIAVPAYLLAREASQHVKVVLSGDGADESLAGYMFHRVIALGHAIRRAVPPALLDGVVAPAVAALPAGLLGRLFDYPAELGEAGKAKLLAYLAALRIDDPTANYRLLISMMDAYDKDGLYTDGFRAGIAGEAAWETPAPSPGEGYLDRLLAAQFTDWLPDNILARLDKMTMAHGLEARTPYLDHRLVEFLRAVPDHLKLGRLGGNKVLLRRWAERMMPRATAWRRKRPFYIPVENYLGHPVFRGLVEETLSPTQVARRGYFRPAAVAGMVGGLRRGEFLGIKRVVALVMLELWHNMFIDGPTPVFERPAARVAGAAGIEGATAGTLVP